MKLINDKILERVTNLAVIIVAVMIVATVMSSDRSFGRFLDHPPTLRGQRIRLTSFTSTPAKLNIVLGLSTTCHFCEEDTDLYKRLSELNTPGKTQLFAVFPQDGAQAGMYLSRHGIRADAIQSSPLPDYKITSTPTILFVGPDGTIKDAWIGSLDETQKSKVLDQIRKSLT